MRSLNPATVREPWEEEEALQPRGGGCVAPPAKASLNVAHQIIS